MSHQRNPKIVIIGAGMSGLLMAIKLKEAGITDFQIYEKASEIGGTWRENTYPGIACDVASHYFTYKFEPNANWSSRLPKGGEIQQYLLNVASKYDLYQHIKFNVEVTDGQHDGKGWHISLSDGEQVEADFMVACCGLLHHPRFPTIKGLDDFAGAKFHSARWDHSVSLVKKRVGIIGNGSTGAQIISELAKEDLQLSVFQRTAQWIFPMPNRQYSKLEQGLARAIPGLTKFMYYMYRTAFENLFAKAVIQPGWQRNLMSRLCRWNLNKVKDPELRKKLTPTYVPLCKRLVMSVDFYPAIQRDNVALITEEIEQIEPAGVRMTDGTLHEVDVLVLATGFDAHAYFRPLNLTNESGVTLNEAWEDGPEAHRTVAVPGFPNFFMTLGPQSPIGNFSAISIAETQIEYIMQCIEAYRERGGVTLKPKGDSTAEFNKKVIDAMPGTIWVTGCTSWYIGKNGVPSAWPFTGREFRKELAQPNLAEFEQSPP